MTPIEICLAVLLTLFALIVLPPILVALLVIDVMLLGIIMVVIAVLFAIPIVIWESITEWRTRK